MNEHHRHEQQDTEPRARIEQLLSGEPREFDLKGGRLDVYTGSPDNFELSGEQDDPRQFSIVDLRHSERDESGNILYEGATLAPDVLYLLVQPATLDLAKGEGYKGIREGDVLDIGRKQATADRFSFSQETSGNHFTVAVDEQGNLLVADNESTNGTSLRVVAGETMDEVSPEDETTAYYRELFAFPEAQGRDRWGNSLDGRLVTTEQSLKGAAEAYRFADDDVQGVIKSYRTDEYRDEDMAKLLRENEALRIELGGVLLNKLDQMRWLPMRLYTSETKNPNHSGYRNMTSREYTALLALSMLDGTYKAPSSDPIERDGMNEIVRGQHRYAAHMVLGTERLADVTRV